MSHTDARYRSEEIAPLAAPLGDLPKESKKPALKQKYKKGPCPLRCELPHPNKSAFFCKLFRGKTLGERRVLVKEAGLCALCLAKI